MTGIISFCKYFFINFLLTLVISPTLPISAPFSPDINFLTLSILSLFPDIPIDLPPFSIIILTICLFIFLNKTFSTIFTVFLQVTLNPFINLDSILFFSNSFEISKPPP